MKSRMICTIFTVIILLSVIIFSPMNAQTQDQAEEPAQPWPTKLGNHKHDGRSPYNTSHVEGGVIWEKGATGGDNIGYSSPVIDNENNLYHDCGNSIGGHWVSQYDTPNITRQVSSYAVGNEGDLYGILIDEYEDYEYDHYYMWRMCSIDPETGTKWIKNISDIKRVDSRRSTLTIAPNGNILAWYESNILYVSPDGEVINHYNISVTYMGRTNKHALTTPSVDDDGNIVVNLYKSLFYFDEDFNKMWELNYNNLSEDYFKSKDIPTIDDDGNIYLTLYKDGNYLFNISNDYIPNLMNSSIDIDSELKDALEEKGLNFSNENYPIEDIRYVNGLEPTWFSNGGNYIFIKKDRCVNVYEEENETFQMLYCFDKNGSVKWNWTPENGELGWWRALDFDNNIYVKTGYGHDTSGALVSLSPEGDVRWKDEKNSILPLVISIDGTLYGTYNKRFCAYDIDKNKIKWKTDFYVSYIDEVAIGPDGTVYVSDMLLYALGEKQERPWENPLLWGGVGAAIVAGVAIYWYRKRNGEQGEDEARDY